VLGDNGSYYVPSELTDIYRQKLLPLATIITPNHFEAEVLSGVTIRSYDDIKQACRIFHSMGVKLCVIKGITLPQENFTVIASSYTDESEEFNATLMAHSIVSNDISQSNDSLRLIRIKLHKITTRGFSGCGDLFTALFSGTRLTSTT
jgi:pyridoxal/pyridoxine/pyridoxamine kinase